MLGLTQSTQAKSTEKLSSGYKINRAADDAAGLSISEKMRKQIRGLSQASTNAQDGISAVQTAEGALNEVQDMLQRMNELAVKAANGTNSEDDRNYIQDEIDQLTTEIDRVAETTKFNETYLLKGDKSADPKINFHYKAGETTNKTVYYTDDNGTVQTLNKGSFYQALDSTKTYYTATQASAGDAIAAANSATYFETEKILKADYYIKDTNGNYTQVAKGTIWDSTETYYTGTYNSAVTLQTMTSQANVSDTGYKTKATVYDSTGASTAANKGVSATTGYFSNIGTVSPMGDTIAIDKLKSTASEMIQFTDKDGNEIAENGLYKYLDEEGNYKGSGLYMNGNELSGSDEDKAKVANLVNVKDHYSTGALKLKLHVGADATDNNQISLELEAMSAEGLGVKDLKVNGADDTKARDAIETIKEALQRVSTQRSALGAVQNRLEHTIANLDNVVENTTSAESTIRDTDMATEMVKYSNNNILAQAGQAMLAQANQSNQGVLSLLG
jgi:flagellin